MSSQQPWGPQARSTSGACQPPSPSTQQAPDESPQAAGSGEAMATTIAPAAPADRALLWAGSAAVLLQGIILVAGSGTAAGLMSNLIQLLLDGIVVAAALRAASRSSTFVQRVWFLVAAAMGVHGVGQALATYCDYVGTWPLFAPWWSDEFLFFWVTPLVVAVVADPLEPRRRLPVAAMLDFLQVFLLGLAWHFSVFGDAIAWAKDGPGMAMLNWEIRLGRDLFVLGCLVARALFSELVSSRNLFRRLALFFGTFALADIVYLYCEAELSIRFGTGMDLVWSLPRWLLILAAATWVQAGEDSQRIVHRRRNLILHLMSLVVPLLILLITSHRVDASPFLLSLLGASITCAGARVLLTQYRQSEALRALTRSRNLLSAVIEGTSQAIYLKDLNGRFLLINSALTRLLGRSRSEIMASRDQDILPPSLLPYSQEADRRVRTTLQTCTEEAVLERGVEKRTLLSTKAPYLDASGTIAGILGIAVDVTPLKETQAELQRWKERCESALRASRHVMYELEPRSGKITIDPTFDRFLGYRPEELPMRASQWRRMVHEDDRGGCYEMIGRAVRSGEPFRCEYRVRGSDGKFYHVVEHGQVFPGQDGRPFRIIGFVEDVTEQRVAAERLKHAQRLESLGTLAAGVAHDFNNLLTVINGYSELLLNPVHGPGVQEAAQSIHHASERAAGLVRQLLAFSRQQHLSPRLVDLNQSVTGVYKMLRRLIPENVEIRMELEKEIGSVKADPGQLEQIILNLAVNARDAMPSGGALTIATYEAKIFDVGDRALGIPPGEYVVLSVEDTGIGIPPEVQARIFEPFFTTKEPGRGTGLGLATVHGIVTQSGGQVRVSSEAMRGSTFQIYLPKVAGRPAQDVPAMPIMLRHGGEHILLVEDDPNVRRLVASALRNAGFEVTGVEDPRLALNLVKERRVDLLISDLVLPGMNGRELSRKIIERSPGTRVVFITGHIDHPVVDQVIADRATLLQKPFGSGRLLDSVRRTLDA